MQKVYVIGRDVSCDIVVEDSNNYVSRQHATLRIDGKNMFITDHSTNGTYRNGILLDSNVEYPVSREDEISFGNGVFFDWNRIPGNRNRSKPRCFFAYVFLAVAIAILLAGGYYIKYRMPKGEIEKGPVATAPDTTNVKKDSIPETKVTKEVVEKKRTIKKADTPKSTKSYIPKTEEVKAEENMIDAL